MTHWTKGKHADMNHRVQQPTSPATWSQPPIHAGGPVDGYTAALLLRGGESAERIVELVAQNGGRT
jgi:hypothetical protein